MGTLKIIEATIDRKLALAKLQTQIVGNDDKSDQKSSNDNNNNFTDSDKSLLRELFNEKKSKSNTDYNLD